MRAIAVCWSIALIALAAHVVHAQDCSTLLTCATCTANAACGFCAATGLCRLANGTGPALPDICTAQWQQGNPQFCPNCPAKTACGDCAADARCAWCPSTTTAPSCVVNIDFAPTPAAPAPPRSYGAACPAPAAVITVAGSCPALPSLPPFVTSSDGGASKVATGCVVLLAISATIAMILLWFKRHTVPVLGRATHTNVGGPKILNQSVSIDSSQNPAVKFILFALLIGMFLLIFIGMCYNDYSSWTLSDNAVAALQAQGATPDRRVTAGFVGFSGLNLPQGSRYQCGMLSGSDNRACGTMAAAAGFTLLFSLISLLLSLVILLWGAMAASHAHASGVKRGGKQPAMHFHPRLFTLTAILCVSLLYSVLFWALGAHLSLRTGIFVPYSDFVLGSSWGMQLACFFFSIPLLWFFWNVVEFSYLSEGSAAAAGPTKGSAASRAPVDSRGVHLDINASQGSNGGEDATGLDLPEEDQQEAYVVRNQLTQ